MTGLRHLSRPLVVAALLGALPLALDAQDPVRPWLAWRTARTPRYRFHFPPELEPFATRVASRVESIDSALARLVGHSPDRAVHVVVDDPFALANGYALPMMERPVTVWWATPPDPRNDIGNFGSWGEMIAIHELAHLAHLTRPSRNPFQRRLWSSLPTNLGPITRKAPRWLYEGYATLIEGRVTGTGRPNNAWRPAILRQWAIEGRLPTYAQLSGWDGFTGGEFAYLGGSAYLDWLARRDGDSSLVHLWRRMTARIVRGFESSFSGVYGDSPAALYGVHVAELTRDAMAAKAALERAGLVEGELVQRLSWATGDPAVSPDGDRVAVLVRERDRPGRLEIWTTRPDAPDTAAVRRRVEAQMKDPLDVPDRPRVPARKKPVRTLFAHNGRSYQFPRWLPDNRRLVASRWTARGDGTLTPDLYLWDTDSGGVRRVTRGAGVVHADPAPDGRDAVAMRCGAGRCDIVRVDLATGAIIPVLNGHQETSYFRPRYSPDGMQIAAAVSAAGRWRILVAARDGSLPRLVDPDDGANRYDVEWLGRDSLVVVSELGGVANLETIDLADGRARTLTRVTGAALGPGVNRADGSIWFLSLHSRGHDVRRLPPRGVPADSVVPITSDRFGFVGVRLDRDSVPLGENRVSASRPYGGGPRHQRWLPGAHLSGDGGGASLTVFSGDVVGRFNATVTGAIGEGGTVQGGALRMSWRRPRPAIEIGVRGFLHEPSLGRRPQPFADSLDAAVFEGLLAFAAERAGEGWQVRGRVGGSAGHLDPVRTNDAAFRGLGFVELGVQLRQRGDARGLVERLRVHASSGHARTAFRRVITTVELATSGPDVMPLQLRGTYGRVGGMPTSFERFSIGGTLAPLIDSSSLASRHAMPALPSGVAVGRALAAWRVAIPANGWTIYYEGASASENPIDFRRWQRAVGLDLHAGIGPVPVAFVPRLSGRVGGAYTLDAPFRRRVRAFLELRVEP